jgi:uncharacterized damage-inducible protein DinB
MKTKALLLALAIALPATAQPAAPAAHPGNAALTGLSFVWTAVKSYLVKSAEKMPEADYAFKPSPDVRSFGQLVGHVADANFMFARLAAGEKPEPRNIEKTKTTKADLVAALKESIAACDKVFERSDADYAASMTLFGKETNRWAVVGLIVSHGYEHYGNMTTYLRIKGIVPPSSEPRPATPKAPEKK